MLDNALRPVVESFFCFARLYRTFSQPSEDSEPAQQDGSVQIHSRIVDECLSQERGNSFNGILTLKRLETSKILLRNTKMKICKIAGLIGYHKPAYYSELFKRYYHKTPNEFRNGN